MVDFLDPRFRGDDKLGVIRIVLEPRSASFRLVCMPKRLRADDERGVDNRDSPIEAALPQIGVVASSQ